jgi:hypothetical protein
MVLPPLLSPLPLPAGERERVRGNFRLGPAFAFDYILRLEVNGKMTERLQIGNVSMPSFRA